MTWARSVGSASYLNENRLCSDFRDADQMHGNPLHYVQTCIHAYLVAHGLMYEEAVSWWLPQEFMIHAALVHAPDITVLQIWTQIVIHCASVMWKRMVMWGHVKSTMCCWQMESSQKWCETAGGKLCNPWKLSRNWAAKHGCSRGPWAMQPQRIRATSDKSLTTGLREKSASGVHATFLSEAADASHWFFGARH